MITSRRVAASRRARSVRLRVSFSGADSWTKSAVPHTSSGVDAKRIRSGLAPG